VLLFLVKKAKGQADGCTKCWHSTDSFPVSLCFCLIACIVLSNTAVMEGCYWMWKYRMEDLTEVRNGSISYNGRSYFVICPVTTKVKG